MRIVVCYYFRGTPIPLGKDLAAALARLGHQVHCFDSSARETRMGLKRVAKSLAKLVGAKERLSAHFTSGMEQRLAQDFTEFCARVSPELIVVIRGEQIPLEALAAARSSFNARTVLWWVKNPRWQSRLGPEVGHYDKAFCIDESSCGDGIEYLPSWSVNREVFHPGEFAGKARRMLFLGSWSARRQEYLETIADLPLEIIGPDWLGRLPLASPLRKKVIAERVDQTEMAARYRSAWAVVDINQIAQTQEQGVNMRFADVPASGTVLITEPSREISRWQMDGKCAVLITSKESLRKAVQELLEDSAKCEAMSLEASKISRSMPSFDDRAATILKFVA